VRREVKEVDKMAEGAELKSENWVMVVSEQHRYQGVSYKSDIIVISGLDPGDRQVLEYKYSGCDPPCLLDSSDGRFVLKGPCYNPMDVINALMTRRGYKVTGSPQQRTLPNIHNKDDKFAFIYHLSKEAPLRRTDTMPSGWKLVKEKGLGGGGSLLKNVAKLSRNPGGGGGGSLPQPSAPAIDEPDLTRQASDPGAKAYMRQVSK